MLKVNQLIGFGAGGSVTEWDENNATALMTVDGRVAFTTFGGGQGVRATPNSLRTSGKLYFEVDTHTITSNPGNWNLSLSPNSVATGEAITSPAGVLNLYITSKAYLDRFANNYGTHSNNDVVNVAADFDAGKLWYGVNGTWFGSGDPAAGTNEMYTILSVDYRIHFTAGGITSGEHRATLRVLDSEFSYTPPSGFSAWG